MKRGGLEERTGACQPAQVNVVVLDLLTLNEQEHLENKVRNQWPVIQPWLRVKGLQDISKAFSRSSIPPLRPCSFPGLLWPVHS